MVVAGPAVIGPKGLIFHHLAAPFPLFNPGIISIPCGFLAGWVATVLSVRRTAESDAIFESMELRALTGLGAEAPTEH